MFFNHRQLIKFLTHPIFVFVALQILLAGVVALWLIFFLGRYDQIAALAETFGEAQTTTRLLLTYVILGCTFLGIILLGTVVLFVVAQRQSAINRQQKIFLSSVTHELRSPLASLQLALDTVKSRVIDAPTLQRMYDMMSQDGDRLAGLIEKILVSARLDRGMMTFEHSQYVNIRGLLTELCSSASHLDSSLCQRLQVECPEQLEIFAPRLAVGIVLGNLLENAVKYSPRGSPIQFRATCFRKEIQLSVKDAGFGLQGRERRKVFKLFYRSQRATDKAVPGSGLGLYIVQSVVKGLGGRTWAESEGPSKGSTFFVAFPAQLVEG